MSLGPASAWPDQAKATRLPSGDNAGGPSTPGYEASGSNSTGVAAGVRSVRQMSTAATTPTTAIRAPTVNLARLRPGDCAGCCGSARCDSARTTGEAVGADEVKFDSKAGT